MEIHCDIPQDQAVRAQKKNDQLGGLKPRKGLKTRDPNKIVESTNGAVVKPQQASVSINLDSGTQRKKLGDVSNVKKHKAGKVAPPSSKVASRPKIFSDFDDIESPAGRLGVEEEAYHSRQRMKKVPRDFPGVESVEVDCVEKKMHVEDDVDSSMLKPSLIDESEIDEILQKVDKVPFKYDTQDGGGGSNTDFPICEVEFDLDFQ